jgi:hypothetical protein
MFDRIILKSVTSYWDLTNATNINIPSHNILIYEQSNVTILNFNYTTFNYVEQKINIL